MAETLFLRLSSPDKDPFTFAVVFVGWCAAVALFVGVWYAIETFRCNRATTKRIRESLHLRKWKP